MIEASTRNVSISTPTSGVVGKVNEKVGDRVKQGQALFHINGCDLETQLATRQAATTLAKLQIREAELSLANARRRLDQAKPLHDRNVISPDEFAGRGYDAALSDARAASARANADLAAAQLQEAEAAVERLTVRAPIAGDILQVNVAPGEYAQTGALSKPLILMGDTQTLHVRIDIDENDAWRFTPGTPAKGFLRGNSAISFDLRFAYVEPFVVPKSSLTGLSAERVDTRVLQVIYSVSKGNLPLYVGQQVDVYVKADDSAVAPRRSDLQAVESHDRPAVTVR
ncbi:efflux RND transporter periplasmic adaptor subunit [Bradyrhizobium cosmicum]|uniref:efflux RND transporter periplasmic adaptor subunit n=1 Tax=Bradyrhizobium cosmicum TaxID=1404864 RepID=UPI0028EF302E|nr:efflux RND transporter periplasmic adaptor subunit [Bradyrhizobium cosmicum]